MKKSKMRKLWEGKNLIVYTDKTTPFYLFGGEYIIYNLKRKGREDLALHGHEEIINKKREHQEFMGIHRWKYNPAVWKLIKDDVKKYEKYRYGVK